MNRRIFLALGFRTGTLLTLSACNQSHGKIGDTHAQHTMPNNSHEGHGTSGAESIVQNMKTNTPLLPVSEMPSGAPLTGMALLKNEAVKPNTFQATVIAKETTVELVKGKPTTFWTYNDQIPGPQIVVYEGDSVEIHFVNQLKQPTTVHWHGLPVSPEQDGNPHDPIEPNGQRIYRFTLPMGCAGTYWYHTHAHNHAAEQAFRGLAGSFIVKAKNDPLKHLFEQHWLISDLRLDHNGKIAANDMMDWMNGREGQFVLINGQYQPAITLQGNERIRIWNACSARYLKLAIPNCEFIVVGTDGGLIQQPSTPVTELLVAPAERFEVVVQAKQAGTFPLNMLPYNRQKMMVDFVPQTQILAKISTQVNSIKLPKQLRVLNDLGKAVAQKKVEFSEMAMDDMMRQMQNESSGDPAHESHGMSQQQRAMTGMFYVNGKTFDMSRYDMTSKVGEVEEWLIVNKSHMDHPFHLHGTQFQIIEHINNGKSTPAAYRAFKDTVNLKPNEQIRIKTIQKNKGVRMFHCHILEHEALGMMAQLRVV